MSRFYGSEICMLDAKGRINVPARMRKNLAPEANDQFMIVRLFDPCVNLYPIDEWEKFEAKLSSLNSGDPEAREFARGIFGNAVDATLDSQGRLNIPDDHLKWAGLKKESKLVGNLDHMELWLPETYDTRSSSLDQNRMQELARRLLS